MNPEQYFSQMELHANALGNIMNQMNSPKETLRKMQSIADKEMSNFYHKIERVDKFNACEGYYIAKELKKILSRRRSLKTALALYGMQHGKHK
jgi:hypothetical protein